MTSASRPKDQYQDCLDRAAEATEVAAASRDLTEKQEFERLAQGWRDLANQVRQLHRKER